MPREVDPYIEFAAELAFIMTEKTREYFACMLRVWSVRDDQKAILRASLQNAQTGERRGFASLAELFDYLRVQAEAMLDPKVIEKKKTDDVKSGETKPVDLKGSQKLGVNSIELRSLRSG